MFWEIRVREMFSLDIILLTPGFSAAVNKIENRFFVNTAAGFL